MIKIYIYTLLLLLALSFQGYAINSFEMSREKNRQSKTQATNTPSNAAKEIINNIVNQVGLKPNFEIRAAKISNAAAVNYGGKRYILYDPDFMNKIQTAAKTDWAAISILAHEIAHHLNGHTMLSRGSSHPSLELEADEFSGFVLRKMGASLSDAQMAMKIMSEDTESSTHPGRKSRMIAIAKGYNTANDQILAASNPPTDDQVQEQAKAVVVNNSENVLSGSQILSEVHFKTMPDRRFFLTRKLDFVEVTEEGVQKLGKLVKENDNNIVLSIQTDTRRLKFRLSTKGLIYNDHKSIVGYLKNPSA